LELHTTIQGMNPEWAVRKAVSVVRVFETEGGVI
jgi:hypothetical protein